MGPLQKKFVLSLEQKILECQNHSDKCVTKLPLFSSLVYLDGTIYLVFEFYNRTVARIIKQR